MKELGINLEKVLKELELETVFNAEDMLTQEILEAFEEWLAEQSEIQNMLEEKFRK